MNSYIDAILHIADLPALAHAIAAVDPGRIDPESGTITGFAATPAARRGAAALVYVRMTEAEAAQWRGTPGVTILAEAPYDGPATPDAVYAALWANPAASVLYDQVYDRTPRVVEIAPGETVPLEPPERFGQLG